MQDIKEDLREILIPKLYANKHLAHKTLFPHKHKNADAPFHYPLLELFYSKDPWVAAEAFRGGAKSTRMEEIMTLSALFQDYKYGIIIGNSYDRACERLASIKHEFEQNEEINHLFGDQVGGTWAADQIILPNGCKLQAFGARQSLRGAKHNDQRPDFCFVDDLEDEENVFTEEARRKLKRWFNGALIPAMDPTTGRIRMVGTPMHPRALIEEKMKDPAWKTARFPAMYLDDNGEWQSSWPDRFPLEYLRKLEQAYISDGNYAEFMQEFMCKSEDAAAKPFQANMIKVAPAVAVWTPVKIMVDPARTTKLKTSARTGYAVWSWMGPRLTVHDAFGAFHKPDEIIKTIFELDEKFKPVEIGVEADGLEEFIMQPLRSEMLKRGMSIPLVPMRAPKSKEDFIKGLQPFYLAGEVTHAADFPDLVSELLQFPTGRIDVPNALAYALKMRVGKPVYEDFSMSHISPTLEIPVKGHKVYMAVSARPSSVAAALVQYVNGRVFIYKDWVKEGSPLDVVEGLLHEAIMFAGREVIPVAPKEQFDKFNNYGLNQAFKQLRLELRIGGAKDKSAGCLTPWLRKTLRGEPAIVVSDASRWVLNGFSDGYARKTSKSGVLNDYPEENQYQLVMEAVESFVRWFDVASQSNDSGDNTRRYATSVNGQRYLTTRDVRV